MVINPLFIFQAPCMILSGTPDNTATNYGQNAEQGADTFVPAKFSGFKSIGDSTIEGISHSRIIFDMNCSVFE